MENFERREKATDIELVLFLIKHIEEPCKDLNGNNIREFYIKEAIRVLPAITNPDAKKMLDEIILKYSKEPKK